MNAERKAGVIACSIILVTLPLAAEASLSNGEPANYGIKIATC